MLIIAGKTSKHCYIYTKCIYYMYIIYIICMQIFGGVPIERLKVVLGKKYDTFN